VGHLTLGKCNNFPKLFVH